MSSSCIFQLVVFGEDGHHGANVEVIVWGLDQDLVMDLVVKDMLHFLIDVVVEVALVCTLNQEIFFLLNIIK